jgi:hypothetical protein
MDLVEIEKSFFSGQFVEKKDSGKISSPNGINI